METRNNQATGQDLSEFPAVRLGPVLARAAPSQRTLLNCSILYYSVAPSQRTLFASFCG